MKRILSFFLVFCCIMFSFPVYAFSSEGTGVTEDVTASAFPPSDTTDLTESTVNSDAQKHILIQNKNNIVEVGSSVYKIKYKLVNFKSKTVSFHSSDSKIASVSKEGIVTGRKKGIVTITVKAKDVSSSVEIQVVSECLRLNANSAQLSREYSNVTRFVFGKSEQNRPLEAYIISPKKGKTKKIYVMTFALHGFEDAYARDGKVLTQEGNRLVEYYAKNPSKLKGFTLVIVPCLNPDGTISGKNNYYTGSSAFGRCTSKHIDLNRDFCAGRMRAREAKAMVKLMKKYNPNLFTDFHGWQNMTMGYGPLCRYFDKSLSLGVLKGNQYFYHSGYLLGYVRHKYQCPCALVEYKSPNKVSHKQTYTAINRILANY